MPNEYAGMLGAVPSPPDPRDHVLSAADISAALAGAQLPSRYIAPAMGPVLNQGKKPYCVAYASAGLKQWQERAEGKGIIKADPDTFYGWLKRGRGTTPGDGIAGDGSTGRAAMRMMYQQGFPIVGHPEWATANRIAGYWSVPVDDRDTLRAAILALGPVLTGEEWDRAFFHPVNGVVPKPSGILDGGHATLRIGWDMNLPGLGKPAWCIKNSWGVYTGSTVSGCFWLPMDYESRDGRGSTVALWEAWKSKDMVTPGPR